MAMIGLAGAGALLPHWIAFAQRPEFEVASVKRNTTNGPVDAVPRRSGDLIARSPFRSSSRFPGGYAQILQPPGLVQVQKLPPRRPLDGLKPPDPAIRKEGRGVRALERPDQIPSL
jgi:hypothetical protein